VRTTEGEDEKKDRGAFHPRWSLPQLHESSPRPPPLHPYKSFCQHPDVHVHGPLQEHEPPEQSIVHEWAPPQSALHDPPGQ
jgi:hypothetical protein